MRQRAKSTKMKFAFSFLAIVFCVLSVTLFTNGQQYDGLWPGHLNNYLLRNAFGNEQHSIAEQRFFVTQYLPIATSTLTSTTTTTVTCTTSTAALVLCSPSSGRKRRAPSALTYSEEDESGDIFLPSTTRTERSESEKAIEESKPATPIFFPFMVQPGIDHNLPRGGRFFLGFTTSTTTSITTSTLTTSLTAVCSSLTQYPLCGFLSGK